MFGLLDKAEVTITVPRYVLMEDTVDCFVNVIPKTDASLRKIEIELFCQETAISRGTSDSYYHKKVYSDERIPRKDFKLKSGQQLQFKETFKLPEFTTPTLHAQNHYVQWFVRVRLDVPWWPDTRKEQSFAVLPYLVVPEE